MSNTSSRHFRFSLKALLLALTVVAAICGAYIAGEQHGYERDLTALRA